MGFSPPSRRSSRGAGTGEQETKLSDASLLGLVGALLFLAGLGLLIFALSEMMYPFPPTIGKVTNILLGLVLGLALLVTGFMYTVVARAGEDPEVGPEGLSLTRDPATGSREWIKAESVVKATLRPWSMSPWLRRRKYYEVELEVKEGDMVVDDRFYVHVGDDDERFLAQMRERFGDRLQLAAPG